MGEINDEEYRNLMRDAVQKTRQMYRERRYKSVEYAKYCLTVADLIEYSDYGRQKADSNLLIRLGSNEDIIHFMSKQFPLAHKLQDIADEVLGRFGEVLVETSLNLDCISTTLIFEPRI